MAQLSGSEPISAANLKSVIGSGVPEIALLNNTQETAQSVDIGRPVNDFDILLVDIMYRPQGSATIWTTTMLAPGFSRTFMGSTGTPYTVEVSGNTVSLTDNLYNQNLLIGRVIGIRVGGGQLLADILAALKGVA